MVKKISFLASLGALVLLSISAASAQNATAPSSGNSNTADQNSQYQPGRGINGPTAYNNPSAANYAPTGKAKKHRQKAHKNNKLQNNNATDGVQQGTSGPSSSIPGVGY